MRSTTAAACFGGHAAFSRTRAAQSCNAAGLRATACPGNLHGWRIFALRRNEDVYQRGSYLDVRWVALRGPHYSEEALDFATGR
ncbi:hypothetical protein [Tahibacter amnicola]|uniref:Uncharacterized protein n=1 Tax=Tahibacter amnicola TaxID=2976241 RepID=A0ABY6B7E3_9GAMM|nr:hypothetical protein [Tahibacter amnicola]UXI65914.1 hypothetical protein N4264_14230 [Tahibacter amnicola]